MKTIRLMLSTVALGLSTAIAVVLALNHKGNFYEGAILGIAIGMNFVFVLVMLVD